MVNGAVTKFSTYLYGTCSNGGGLDDAYVDGPAPIKGGQVAQAYQTPPPAGDPTGGATSALVGYFHGNTANGTISYTGPNGCGSETWTWTAEMSAGPASAQQSTDAVSTQQPATTTADAAFTAFQQAKQSASCSKALDSLDSAGYALTPDLSQSDFTTGLTKAKADASAFRDALFASDAATRNVSFPDSAKGAVNAQLVAAKAEIADLDAYAGTSDVYDAQVLLEQTLVDDDQRDLANQSLATALGHPADDPGLPVLLSDDQLNLASATLVDATALPIAQFRLASDLPSKQAAVGAEATALTTYIPSVSAINFPTTASKTVIALFNASTALAKALGAQAAATSVSAIGDSASQFAALRQAAAAIDSELQKELIAIPAPPSGCLTKAPAASPTTSPPAAPIPAALHVPLQDAAAARDALLQQALTSTMTQEQVVTWLSGDTGLSFGGSGYAATPTLVSGGNQFVTSKVKNTQYMAFAVTDTAGHCAGGLLLEDPTATKVTSATAVTLPAGAPCSMQTVSDAAGY